MQQLPLDVGSSGARGPQPEDWATHSLPWVWLGSDASCSHARSAVMGVDGQGIANRGGFLRRSGSQERRLSGVREGGAFEPGAELGGGLGEGLDALLPQVPEEPDLAQDAPHEGPPSQPPGVCVLLSHMG